ncbi:MAG: cation:proton antiporter [Lachnospiraceae bacterium]|nr:cation:proton antiporter [Lachnospiraceae bacterium]
MESYLVFKDLAIIVVFAKVFGILARKLKAPQVVGEIIAGLLIGPSVLGLVNQSTFLSQMAEIGVILLMFSAGLETNLHDLIKTGLKATLIACAGVFIPLVGGFFLYRGFYGPAGVGTQEFYSALFVGVILTATSVSITVQALREMGRLKGYVGTTILSAAIIDDIIGIIVLTVVMGLKDGGTDVGMVAGKTALFFVFSIGVGFIIYQIFKAMDARYPHTRRIPIMGLALCLAMSFVAEKYFGIADITGAYVAGIILCNVRDSEYIAEKMDINSYMLFGPIFFASIGLKTDISEVNMSIIWFSLAFVAVGLLCKIVGCGLMAKLCRFTWADSAKIGVGMMTRGEVALITSQKGLSVGLLSPVYFTAVILLIIFSSILTPIILKLLYSKTDTQEGPIPSKQAA